METPPPHWLISPSLGKNNRWLTANVEKAMEDYLRSAPQMEPQEIIDEEISRRATLANGQKAAENPELLDQLRKEFSTIQPLRFEYMLKPLMVDNSYSHVPPATVMPHSDSTITPFIIPFPDGGRLILIDPLNHVFLAPMCCALLVMACYDLNETHFAKLLDTILVTAAFYSPHRYVTEELLNKKIWNEDSEKLMRHDPPLGEVAERMAFNIIAFALYHEVSHSILNHIGSRKPIRVQPDGDSKPASVFTWRQQQELEADAQGCLYFQELINISCANKNFWTGDCFDHAPLVFFLILGLSVKVQNQLTDKNILSSSHPSPAARLEALQNRMTPLSEKGKEAYNLIASSVRRVEHEIDKMDLKKYFSPKLTPKLL